MLSLLARYFRVDDAVADMVCANVGYVCVASYSGKNEKALSTASEVNMSEAIGLVLEYFPRAIIIFGSCSHPYLGAEKHEEALKIAMCEGARVKFISAGAIINSVGEMDAWKKAIGENEGDIVIVTCDFHSRSERRLAKRILKGRKVFLRANSYEHEVESDHPTPDQRTWLRWLPCSFIRLAAVTLAPLHLLRGIHHKGAN
jgi:hypothetical protein